MLTAMFQPARAGMLEAGFRIVLKNEGADEVQWHFGVSNGRCVLSPSENDSIADVVLVLSDDAFHELMSGKSDVPSLYAARRLAIRGNIDLALRFTKLFRSIR